MDFKIINFDEGIFDLNHEISLPKDREVSITVRLLPIFRYSTSSEIVVCQLTLKYSFEDNDLLTYGFAVAVAAKGWKEFVNTNPEKDAIVSPIYGAWNASINAGRGVLIDKTKDTEFKQFLIPDIPEDKLKTILRIEKIEE